MMCDLLGAHAGVPDVDGDGLEDGGREGEVEEAVGSPGLGLVTDEVLIQVLEVGPRVVAPGHVEVERPKLLMSGPLVLLHLKIKQLLSILQPEISLATGMGVNMLMIFHATGSGLKFPYITKNDVCREMFRPRGKGRRYQSFPFN